MRTISIFILFVCLAGLSTTGGEISKASSHSSNLKLIAEDFRILSRVINAIYLQSAVIQREIKAPDILSEILQIKTESLIDIMNVDVLGARSEINRMHKESATDILSRTPGAGLAMELTIRYLVFFKRIKHSHQMETFVNSTKIPSVEFSAAAASIKNDAIFNYSCSKFDAENLQAIANKLSSEFGTIETPSNSEMLKKKLFKYRDESSQVMSCLDSISQLRQDIGNLKIRNLKERFDTVRMARVIATRFVNLVSDGSEAGSINFLLGNFGSLVETSRSVWAGDISQAAQLQLNIENLHKSVQSVQEYNQDYEDFDFIHTVGFYNSSDMIKVYDDLKSPWFQKHIAKGANTTNLTRAFRPFRLVSQKIIELEITWDRFAASAEKDLTVEVSEGLRFLSALKRFAVNSTSELQTLDDLQKKLQVCIELKNSKFNQSQFEVYELQEHQVRNVIDRTERIYEHISELQDTLDEPLGTKLPRSEYVRQVMIGLEQAIRRTKVGWISEEMEAVNNRDDASTYEVFRSIASLGKELNELKAASELINETNLVESMGMVKDLKLIDVSQCIIDTIPDEQFDRTFRVLEAFLGLIKFPTKEVIDQINRYLNTLMDVQTKMEDISITVDTLRTRVIKNGTTNPFLSLKHSRVFSENIGICTGVLEEMDAALQNMQLFTHAEFERPVREKILDEGLPNWYYSPEDIDKFFSGIRRTDQVAGNVLNGSLVDMAAVFEQAARVKGFLGTKEQLHKLYESLISHYKTRNNSDVRIFEVAQHLDLDFVKHHSRLQNARMTIINVQKYFDDLFGHTKQNTRTITIEKHIKPAISWQVILLMCIGFVIVALMVVLFVYGMTEKGKAHYKNLYIYYFGRHEDFEKRWRYSLFMDTVDEKNALLDAVREGNKPNLLKALKNGAYIDAYNKFGNTALHVATKYALPDHVELLITYGADRSLLNSKNLLPIQMIPHDYEKKFPNRIGKFEKIKTIYKKYEKKAFKICVPQAFPDSSFHIWMDDKVDEALGDHFLEKFRAITSDEPIPTTTHVVFKTDKHGVLDTDRPEALMWVFHGAVIVKEQWLTDCLNHDSLIRKDVDYLIEKVKYKGVTYDTVLAWSEAMAKATMPYLLGVFVAVVAPDVKSLLALSSIVTTQGGIFLNVFPHKDHFNKGSRPYLHAHLGPLFLIHDGTQDLTIYRNDPDRMYTLFTEEDFMIFMLKRETYRDTRINPPVVMIGDDF